MPIGKATASVTATVSIKDVLVESGTLGAFTSEGDVVGAVEAEADGGVHR